MGQVLAGLRDLFNRFFNDERGQGAFEYIMLVAGVLLVVVLAVVVLRTNVLPGAGEQLGQSLGEWRKLVQLNCSSNGTCYTS